MKKLLISTYSTDRGIALIINKKKYNFDYPQNVWHSFPTVYKKHLAETAAYFFTFHLGVKRLLSLHYHFPPPPMHSLFFHGFLFAMGATNYEISNFGLLPAKLIKKTYNAAYQTQFLGINPPLSLKFYKVKQNTAVIPFTFGKDSLLTYALCQQLGINTQLFFFVEPTSIYENEPKFNLSKKFEKEFGTKINFIENPLGKLRQNGKQLWGWDMLITQYSLLLLPYLNFYKSQYLLWSHERSVNTGEGKDHGFMINVSHEQSRQWMLHLNNLLRSFGSPAILRSLLESLHEIVIMYILHRQFPNLGKYQHSCLGDKKSRDGSRWCGKCYECARVYLFLLAIDRDPQEVGFTQNLLNVSNKKYYLIFGRHEIDHPIKTIKQYGERMLAFYLAYQKGVRGGVMDLFVKYYFKYLSNSKQKLLNKYLKIYSDITFPEKIDVRLSNIFRKNLQQFKNEIR